MKVLMFYEQFLLKVRMKLFLHLIHRDSNCLLEYDYMHNHKDSLCKNILTRYPIPARNVVGHSDISPRRKMDPGELFDWQLLAAMGIGLWPKVTNDSRVEKFDATLSAIGYEIDDIQATVRAFQRRYLPTTISGIADKKTLQAISALHKLIVS